MGPKALKIRVISAALAAAALFCQPAFAEPAASRTPASQVVQETPAPAPQQAMAQADAFSTAGEQAAFLGAYQMHFGPYGKIQNKEERDKLLRETAEAIDDCINGRACGEKKQQKVLKALVQYNMGQDVKMMMLTNNTNAEKMRSIDNSSDTSAQKTLNQAEIKQALENGRNYIVDQADPIKPYQRREAAKISRDTGSTKEPTYMLDELSVTHKIDDTYLREREILGERFLKDYASFLDDFATTNAGNERRFYKYVPAKSSKELFVYDDGRNGAAVNEERFREVESEQQNRNVREALANYKKNLKPIKGYKGEDGKAHITSDGSSPQELGIGEMTEVDPAMFPGMKFDDLMQDGKITPANQGRAIARIINESIKKGAREKEQEQEKAAGSSRSLASSDENNPQWINTVTLSPEAFDKFLDQIWPSSADRKRIISSTPANPDPAAEPEPEDANRNHPAQSGSPRE